MTDSFRLRLVMTCADNISAVQHEKRARRVKCTLYTQSQEATKTNGTTLTESRGKNDLRTARIYPLLPGIDCLITADDSAQFPMVSLASFCLPVRRSTCSFKLICSSPGFAVLDHVSTIRFGTRSWHLVSTRQISVHCASLHRNLPDCCAA